MNIECMHVGAFEVNCYLARLPGGRALLIDPGADAPRLIDRLRGENLTLEYCLLTHGHVDHIGGLAELLAAFPAPVVMHPRDADWAFADANQVPPYYAVPRLPPDARVALPDDRRLEGAGYALRILETPGHSPGSLCYWFPDHRALFSGDTLFQGTVGRTDLPGGDERLLARSLRVLRDLPPETRVYPGHGPATTLARELQSNPFMRS